MKCPAVICRLIAVAAFAVGCPSAIHAEDLVPIEIGTVSQSDQVDFQNDILPILRKNCLPCHNQSDAESDLVLESPSTILKGGSEGPAISPGKGIASRLLRVTAHLEEPAMPPKENDAGAENLTPHQLGLIKQWIDQGAQGGSAQSVSQITWQSVEENVQPVLSADMTPDGRFAVCGRANRLFVYHVPSGKLVQELVDTSIETATGAKSAHHDFVQSVAFHPSGQLLASGGFESVKVWELSKCASSTRVVFDKSPVRAAVTSDGSRAAVGVATGEIILWDVNSGKALGALAGHGKPVSGLVFTRDGTRIVSCASDQTIRVWSVASLAEIARATTPGVPLAIVLTENDQRIVTGESDKIIRVWELATTEATNAPMKLTVVHALTGHTGAVTSLAAIDADAGHFISGSEDGTLREWRLPALQPTKSFSHGSPVAIVASSPDGQRFVSTGADSTASLWNAADGELIAALPTNPPREFRISAIELQKRLAEDETTHAKTQADELRKQEAKSLENQKQSAAENTAAIKKSEAEKSALAGLMRKHNVARQFIDASKQTLSSLDAALSTANQNSTTTDDSLDRLSKMLEETGNHASGVTELDGVRTSLASAGEAIQAISDQRKTSLEALVASLGEIRKTALQENEKAKHRADELAKSIQKQQGQIATSQRALKQSQASLAQTDRDLERVRDALHSVSTAISTHQDEANALGTQLGELIALRESNRRPFDSAAFSTDGRLLFLGADNGTVWIYDASTGAFWDRFEEHGGPVRAIAPLSGGDIVSVDADRILLRWSPLPKWRVRYTIARDTAPGALVDRVMSLDFSPDGKWLAAGSGEPSRSGVISLWNTADGAIYRAMTQAHSDTVFGLDFSPNSALLASAAADRMASVFRVADGERVRNFEGHSRHVLDVCWSANGRSLATAGADSLVKVWDYESGAQKKTIAGFGKEVTSIAFLGIGRNAASTGGDGVIRIHNTESGSAVRTMKCSDDFAYTVATDTAGNVVITGGADGALQVWNAADGKLIRSLGPRSP